MKINIIQNDLFRNKFMEGKSASIRGQEFSRRFAQMKTTPQIFADNKSASIRGGFKSALISGQEFSRRFPQIKTAPQIFAEGKSVPTIKVCILLLIVFFAYSNSFAQLTESDTLRFGYRLNVNGSWITGNVERLLVNTNLELSHVGQVIGLKSSTSYVYGTIFKNETEDDIFSRNFIYLYPRSRFYPYAMLWVQNSKRQRIKFRYQAGIGATYGVIQSADHQIKLSGTFTHEETRYDGTDFTVEPENLDIDNVTAWRATLRLLGDHHFAGDRVRLHYETWYQPAFGDRNNWRYYLNAALDIPFARHFSFRTALLYTHEQIVLTDIKRDDKILTFGLNWSNF